MRLSVLSLLSLLFGLTLVSCSKDKESDKSKTFITVTNQYGIPLQNLTIGVLKGSSKTDLVRNIGTLEQNAVSGEIEVKDKDTDNVLIFFDHINGKTYMIMQPYIITQGSTTSLTISSIINTSEIQKSSEMYPK